jgi:hypothetical protein
MQWHELARDLGGSFLEGEGCNLSTVSILCLKDPCIKNMESRKFRDNVVSLQKQIGD